MGTNNTFELECIDAFTIITYFSNYKKLSIEHTIWNSKLTYLFPYFEGRYQSVCRMALVKAIGIITLILANSGNVLLLGVIHFEKYGQDPMKRSFPDRLFSTCCWLQIYISFFSNLITNYRSLIGN